MPMLGAGLPSGFIPVEALGGVQRAPVQPAPVPYHGPVQPTTTPWGFPDPVRQPREFLEALIKRVEATDKENYFKWPVDERVAPGYYSKIKHPMCFADIKRKLAENAYTSWKAFVADFDLIVNNARTFNTPKTRCFKCAMTLQRNLNKILKPAELEGRRAFSVLYPRATSSQHVDLAAGGLTEPLSSERGPSTDGMQGTPGVLGGSGGLALLPPLPPAGKAGLAGGLSTADTPDQLMREPSSLAHLQGVPSAQPGALMSPAPSLIPLPPAPVPVDPFCTYLSDDGAGEAAEQQLQLQALHQHGGLAALLLPPPGSNAASHGAARGVPADLQPLELVLHQLRVPVVHQAWPSGADAAHNVLQGFTGAPAPGTPPGLQAKVAGTGVAGASGASAKRAGSLTITISARKRPAAAMEQGSSPAPDATLQQPVDAAGAPGQGQPISAVVASQQGTIAAGAGAPAAGPELQAAADASHLTGRTAEWKAERRPLEWQCRWLELRMHELQSQRRRILAALSSNGASEGAQQQQGGRQHSAPDGAGRGEGAPKSSADVGGSSAGIAAGLKRRRTALMSAASRHLSGFSNSGQGTAAGAGPAPAQPQLPPVSKSALNDSSSKGQQGLATSLFFAVRAGPEAVAAALATAPAALQQHQQADAAGNVPKTQPTNALQTGQQQQQQQGSQQQQQPMVQILPQEMPAAVYGALEVLENQLAGLRRSLQNAFRLQPVATGVGGVTARVGPASARAGTPLGSGGAAGGHGRGGYSAGGARRGGASGSFRGPLTVNTGRVTGDGGAPTTHRKKASDAEVGYGGWDHLASPQALAAFKDGKGGSILIPPVRDLPEQEMAARMEAYTTWNAAYKEKGPAALKDPPPAVAAVLQAERQRRAQARATARAAAAARAAGTHGTQPIQVEVTEADLAQPSSEEDTSDEAYQAMHAVMAEEERKRFAALLAAHEGGRRRNKQGTHVNSTQHGGPPTRRASTGVKNLKSMGSGGVTPRVAANQQQHHQFHHQPSAAVHHDASHHHHHLQGGYAHPNGGAHAPIPPPPTYHGGVGDGSIPQPPQPPPPSGSSAPVIMLQPAPVPNRRTSGTNHPGVVGNGPVITAAAAYVAAGAAAGRPLAGKKLVVRNGRGGGPALAGGVHVHGGPGQLTRRPSGSIGGRGGGRGSRGGRRGGSTGGRRGNKGGRGGANHGDSSGTMSTTTDEDEDMLPLESDSDAGNSSGDEEENDDDLLLPAGAHKSRGAGPAAHSQGHAPQGPYIPGVPSNPLPTSLPVGANPGTMHHHLAQHHLGAGQGHAPANHQQPQQLPNALSQPPAQQQQQAHLQQAQSENELGLVGEELINGPLLSTGPSGILSDGDLAGGLGGSALDRSVSAGLHTPSASDVMLLGGGGSAPEAGGGVVTAPPAAAGGGAQPTPQPSGPKQGAGSVGVSGDAADMLLG